LAVATASSARAGISLEGEGPLAGGTLQINERMEARYYQVDGADYYDPLISEFAADDFKVLNYLEEVNRFNLLFSKNTIAFGMQLDQVALIGNRYYLDEELQHPYTLGDPALDATWDDFYLNLEKVYLRHKGRQVELQLGDCYGSFGRGIALNLVRNTDIDIDTSLRGARAVLRLGDWDITAVSGLTNPQQVLMDNRNLDIAPDLHHMISGLRMERFGLGPLNLGAHGVVYRFARELDQLELFHTRYTEPMDVLVAGATAEAFGLGGIDINAEADFFNYRSVDFFAGEQPDLGYGVYASAAAYPGRTVLLLEAKRYKNTERINSFVTAGNYEVAVAPTMEYERVITEDSSAAVNSNDIMGARLRADYALKPGVLLPYASFAVFRDNEIGGLHFNQVPETILHPLAGIQWLGPKAHIIANGGLRTDLRDDDSGQDMMSHVDLDLQLPAGPLGTLELASAFMHFGWGENANQQEDFTELVNALALHASEHWTFILYQDYTDNPLISSTGNIAEHVYMAGELQYKPLTSATFGLFYGAYKEGIRCAGGQCRKLPGFEGLRVSASGAF